MPENILLRLHRDQVETLQEKLNVWQAERHFDNFLDDVQDVIALCEGFPDRLAMTHRSVLRRMRSGETTDWDEAGRAFQSTFDETLTLMESTWALVKRLASEGCLLRAPQQMEAAVAEVRTMAQTICERWPWTPNAAQTKEAWDAHRRGEGLEPDEAFAEIARMSKEDWLKKVEAYQRTRQS